MQIVFPPFLRIFLVLILLIPAGFPARAAERPEYVETLRRGLELMRQGDWEAALAAAGGPGTVRRDIILWHRLRASEGTFDEALAFLARRPDWPGLKLLRKRAEATIPEDADPARLRAFFAAEPPQTGHGALMYAHALRAAGNDAAAAAQVRRAWTTLLMDEDEEAALLAAWPRTLAPLHDERLDMLLWRGDTRGARRMLPRVSEDQRKLARARIMLRARENGVDAAIAAVPPALADDPGLAYERFLWRAAKGRNGDAVELLLARSTSAAALGQPARWGSWRRTLARWAMRQGKARTAYRLAARHFIDAGSDRNDLEWLAGYIALVKLDDPATALGHFQAFRRGVESPISLGRAGYWLGRAHEALGQSQAAREAYAFGARYQTSFYGQLAAQRIGAAMDPALAGGARFSGWREAPFWGSSAMVAGRLLQAADERYLALRFTQQVSERLSREDAGRLLAWAESVDAPYLQVKLAKYLVRRGLMFERYYYALPPVLPPERAGVPRELTLAIMRRESEFKPDVVSGVGALGLMQLMPNTARDMARRLEEDHSTARLTEDPAYNTRLGQEYLAWLVQEFGANPVLLSVAYNAGPRRARAWREARGHPAAPQVDVIDWIEHIPFRETRNYVMRVTESLAPYRARLAGRPLPLTLASDLKVR